MSADESQAPSDPPVRPTAEELTRMRVWINRPDRFASLGLAAWREGLSELRAALEILWQLVRRDVMSRYRQSLLGLGWAVVTPLAMVSVFFFTDLGGDPAGGVPRALWLYVGLHPWQCFQGSLIRATQALVANPELVKRVRFPREILVLAALGGALFDFAVGSVVLALFFAWSSLVPAWTVVFVPLLVLLQFLFTLALGLALSVLNGALRDLGSMVSLGVLLWMFLTPVVFPADRLGSVLPWLNPMVPMITSWRDLLFTGSLSMPGPLLVAIALTCVLLPLSWRMFHILLPRISETL